MGRDDLVPTRSGGAFVVFPSPLVDALAWGLLALALAFCAVAVLRTPNDEWDLPPLSATSELAPSHLGELE